MARITATDGPQEGDLVVASVTTVKQNGCYVSLDEFDGREGFISSVKSPAAGSGTSALTCAKVSG